MASDGESADTKCEPPQDAGVALPGAGRRRRTESESSVVADEDTDVFDWRGVLTQAASAIDELRDLTEKKLEAGGDGDKAALFPKADDCYVLLNIGFKKIPAEGTLTHVPLAHSLHAADATVCLIVGDTHLRQQRQSHEVDKCANVWKERLEGTLGVTSINEVMSLSQVQREYNSYQLRTSLAKAYDVFLCDARILTHFAHWAGKVFYDAKKNASRVDLNARDVPAEIERQLCKTCLSIRRYNKECSLRVGLLRQPTEHVVANLRSVIEFAMLRGADQEPGGTAHGPSVPGGLMNVRRLQLSVSNVKGVPTMPIYIDLGSSHLVPLPQKRRYGRSLAAEGELSTVAGVDRVKVLASGKIETYTRSGRRVHVRNETFGDEKPALKRMGLMARRIAFKQKRRQEVARATPKRKAANVPKRITIAEARRARSRRPAAAKAKAQTAADKVEPKSEAAVSEQKPAKAKAKTPKRKKATALSAKARKAKKAKTA